MRGVDLRVRAQDVGALGLGHRDHGVGRLEGDALAPARQGIATAELFGLPRAQRLERVHRGDMRHAMDELGQVPAEVRVPGVGVDEVGVAHGGGHRQVDRRGAQRAQLGRVPVERGPRLVAGRAAAVGAPGVHVEVDEPAQMRAELSDVDPRPAVDVGRELAGQQRHAHGPSAQVSSACPLTVSVTSMLPRVALE